MSHVRCKLRRRMRGLAKIHLVWRACPHVRPLSRPQLPPELLRRAFAALGDIPNTAPSWNVAPTQAALVVRRHPETGERRLDALRWGLVPHFTKDLKACKRPINARSETIATLSMFRGALAARRCLVPADAIYEWKAVADGKQPYAVARVDDAPLAFAGLRDPAGEVMRTFTIATGPRTSELCMRGNS